MEAGRPPSPIAWLASGLLVALMVLSLVVREALRMVDALQGGPIAWLSMAIGTGLAASCLAVAVFIAWLSGQPRRRLAAVLGLVVLVLAAGAVSRWLAGRGDELVGFPPPEVSRAAGDPGLPGPHAVEVFDYGPGDDPRPGRGATPGLLTGRFDLAAVAPPPGWTGERTARLGFGPEAVPIAGRAYVPAGPGPFPLVLIAHGTAGMEVRSELGFEELGRLLASRGQVVVAVDQGFLGYGGPGVGDLGRGDVLARARLLLAHAEAWARFAETPDGPLRGRVDPGRLVLVGHSRGGEAAIGAAKLAGDDRSPRRFRVVAVAALAPTANRIPPSLEVAFLTLHGDLDNDVEGFLGLRTYEDVRLALSPDDVAPPFKAAVYVEGANHAKFNERWGVSDMPWPLSLLESRDGALPARTQRRVLAVYLSAFLDATLRADPHGRGLLRDARLLRPLLPGVKSSGRFLDSRGRLLFEFDAAAAGELGSPTFPGARAQVAGATARRITPPLRLPAAFGTMERHVLELSWAGRAPGDPARLAVELDPPGLTLREQALTFDLAFETPVEVTLRLRDGQGRWAVARLRDFFPVWPSRQESLTRFSAAEVDSHELPFQTVVLSARDLGVAAPGFDVGDVRRVELEFGGAGGRVLLDDPAMQPL